MPAGAADLERLREKLREDPRSLAFVPLADGLRREARFEAAMEVLREGLRHHPEHAPARVVLARLHLDAGRRRSAQAVLEEVARADPENVTAGVLYARMLIEEGRQRDALAVLERIGGPEVGEAVALIERLSGAKSHPMPRTDDPFDHPAVAARLVRAGRLDRARELWRRLQRLDPENPVVAGGLAAVEAELRGAGGERPGPATPARVRLPGRARLERVLREEAETLPPPRGRQATVRAWARLFWRER